MSRLLLLALFYISTGAFAQTEVPTADELVQQARKGRAELIDGVNNVRRVVPDMENREELFPYFLKLDELTTIAQGYDFQTTGSDPVKALALTLTRHGAKWMELDRVSWQIFEVFLRRADENTRYSAITQQASRIQLENGPPALLKWHSDLRKLFELCAVLKTDAATKEKVDELQGMTLKRLLNLTPRLSPEELTTAFRHTNTPLALAEALDTLRSQLRASTKMAEIDQILYWVTLLGQNVRKSPGHIPLFLGDLPGTVALEGLSRMLERGAAPVRINGRDLLELISENQKTDLGDRLYNLYATNPPPPSVIEFVWQVANRLTEEYERLGLIERLKDFRRFHQMLAGARIIENEVFEGTYEVVLGDASKNEVTERARLTLAAVGSSNFIIGLNVLHGPSEGSGFGVDYNFFDVVWDLKTQGYVAQYRAVESPKFLFRVEDHYHMKFNLVRTADGKSRIEGVFFNGRAPARYRKLQGELVEAYPTFQPVAMAKPLDEFQGIFQDLTTGAAFQELVITRTGASVGGKYFYDSFLGDLSFEWGYYNPLRNTVFLTTGEYPGSQKWMHLRGQLSPDGKIINGVYIMSGRGIQRDIKLGKVN